jgi:hypothetical protein
MIQIDGLTWILAFSGAAIHILLKIQELGDGFNFKGYVAKNWASFAATIIMIPTILIVLSDSPIGDMLPLNHITALLAGYQTNSLFKTLIDVGKSRYIKNNEQDSEQ